MQEMSMPNTPKPESTPTIVWVLVCLILGVGWFANRQKMDSTFKIMKEQQESVMWFIVDQLNESAEKRCDPGVVGSLTPNLQLNLPAPAQCEWGELLNENFKKLDEMAQTLGR
jgi:hypothetical protein